MYAVSSMPRQKSWREGRRRVSVLAEMALRKERVVERLVQLREQHSLSQEQAAQKVGVTSRQWQRWEAGESMPYPRNFDLIAQRFGISVVEFFDDIPAPASSRLEELEAEVLELREGQRNLADQLKQTERDASDQEESLAALRRELLAAAAAATRQAPGARGSAEQ